MDLDVTRLPNKEFQPHRKDVNVGQQSSEDAIIGWLAARHEAMIALLREMADIESGSYDKPGTDAVDAVAERFLSAHGIQVGHLPQSRSQSRPMPAATGREHRMTLNAGG